MKEIILIEDSFEDAEAVGNLLQSLRPQVEFTFKHLSSLADSQEFLLAHRPDLILLDLEFTEENTTSFDILSAVLSNTPIIILSHLSHYQFSMSQQVNVKAFIRKDTMDHYLVPAVRKALFPSEPAEPLMAVFPSGRIHGIDETVPVSDIRFVEKVGKREYCIYRTNGQLMSIASIGFADLCGNLSRQGITKLQPVSRNEIINTTCIRNIHRQQKGRIEIELINLPNRTFIVGAKYESFFTQHFLSYR